MAEQHDFSDRYQVVESGDFHWGITVDGETRTIGRFNPKAVAIRMAMELLTAFRDGYLAAQSTPSAESAPLTAEQWVDRNVSGSPTLIEAMKNYIIKGESAATPPSESATIPEARVIGRRVVCAAIKVNDHVVCGARHYDLVMRDQLERIDEAYSGANVIQGFIDQRGEFMTREEARGVAVAAGQIVRRCGRDDKELYSENLY